MRLKLQKIQPDLLVCGFILLFTLAFFHRLFLPKPSLFYTVETLGSDLWSFYYPEKEFLSLSLKSGSLPLWSKEIGTGFPVFAEGQAGTFYLPNLVLYKLLPTYMAWNLNYLLVFCLLSIGTYFLFRRFNLSRISSLFGAMVFSFGGYFISRIIHTAPLAVMSLMPWVFLTAEMLLEKASLGRFILFILVFSQQIFAGHPQWVFITLFGYLIFKGTQWLFGGRDIFKAVDGAKGQKQKLLFFLDSRAYSGRLTLLLLAMVLSVGLSAIQTIPTIEYLGQSIRSSGISSDEIFSSDYPFKNLLSLFSINYFGDNRFGVTKIVADSGLDWEVQGYLGVIPLILIGANLFKRKINKFDIGFLVLLVVSVIIIPKSSPFSLINTIPPFNFFRIPSRYLILTTFALCYFASRGMDAGIKIINSPPSPRFRRAGKFQIINSKKNWNAGLITGILIISLATLDIGRFGWNYHSLATVDQALLRPEVLEFIPSGSRTFAPIGNFLEWKKNYSRFGYQDKEAYLYFKNYLYPSIGSLWGNVSLLPSAGFKLNNQLDYPVVDDGILDEYCVDFLISINDIEAEGYEKVGEVRPKRDTLPQIYVYKNIDKLPRIRIEKDNKGNGNEIQEKNIKLLNRDSEDLINVIKDNSNEIEVEVEGQNAGTLVVADSYYPGWKSWVNGNKTEIIQVNLNQRGVIIPEGKSNVVMKFEPESLQTGKTITIITFITFIIIIMGTKIRGIFRP